MDFNTFLENFDAIAEAPGGIPKLRSLLLDLAVRGKLVAQNPEDESAIEALERMQYEKVGTIQAEGYRTKNKKFSLINDEYKIDFPLPKGWTLAELDELCIFIDYRGKTPPKVNSGIRLITAKNVRDGFIKAEPEEFINEETYHNWMTRGFPKEGDVLFTTEAPLGKAAVVDIEERFALAQRIINLRPLSGVYGYFLMWLILSPWFQNELQERATGMTATGIKAAKLKLIRIPLPPLAEQKRIVEKVDELMALCDRYEAAKQTRDKLRQKLRGSAIASLMNTETDEELDAAWTFVRDNWCELSQHPEDVKDLRQSVLELAVRGKLVHQNSSEGEVTDLIELMLSKASFLGNSKNSLLSSGFWEIPENWSWLPLFQFGQIIGGGTPSKGDPDFWSGDIPWVSPKDMKVDYIESSQDFISEKGLNNSTTKLVHEGSILMVIRGMILAHSFPVAVTRKQVTINQDMKALMLFLPEMSDYLLICLKGLKRVFLNLVERSSHGTCRLPAEKLFSQLIPLPPLAEQKRIVAKVDELMRLCDQLEESLRQSQQRAESLAASVISHLTI
jgi:type I restriction enzyme, S subunit